MNRIEWNWRGHGVGIGSSETERRTLTASNERTRKKVALETMASGVSLLSMASGPVMDGGEDGI